MDMIGITTEISISTTCVNSCSEAMITGHKQFCFIALYRRAEITPNALVLAFSCSVVGVHSLGIWLCLVHAV